MPTTANNGAAAGRGGRRASSGNDPEALTRAQRLIVGVGLLLAVDVIWVASSELTRYIFKDLAFDKAFFATYFKTSLFMAYFLGFAFLPHWRQQCAELGRGAPDETRLLGGPGHRRRYQLVAADEEEDEVETEEGDEEELASTTSTSSQSVEVPRTLSSPTWVPANIPESGKSSGAEESEGEGRRSHASSTSTAGRRVRFKNVAQVAQMDTNPADALYANLARLSYNASLRAQAALRRAAARLTMAEVARLAGAFCLPWFLGNYCYQAALSDTGAAVVNILSSSSCLFTLLLAAVFPSENGDRLTLSKLLAVCFSILGVVLISYADLKMEGGHFPSGVAWALSGAFFYSSYVVFLRRKVSNEENLDTPLFFGFVGLFCAAGLWPGLVVLDAAGWETWTAPSPQQLQMLILNGLVGTVLSELLWLWGCFYTSSLLATLSVGLTIPMSESIQSNGPY